MRTADEQIQSIGSRKREKTYPIVGHLLSNVIEPEKKKFLNDVMRCAYRIEKRINLATGEEKIHKALFCNRYKFCPNCAMRRAIKVIRTIQYNLGNGTLTPDYHYYYIVLTIRHKEADSLDSLMNKLLSYRDEISRRISNSKRKTQKTKSFFSQADGMITSIELVYSKTGSGWHPHINVLFATKNPIEIKKRIDPQTNKAEYVNWDLRKERIDITKKESKIVHIRKIPVNEFGKEDIKTSKLGEVLKYSVKFSSIPQSKLLEYFEFFWGRKKLQLITKTGIFRKLKEKPRDTSRVKLDNTMYVDEIHHYNGKGGYRVTAKK